MKVHTAAGYKELADCAWCSGKKNMVVAAFDALHARYPIVCMRCSTKVIDLGPIATDAERIAAWNVQQWFTSRAMKDGAKPPRPSGVIARADAKKQRRSERLLRDSRRGGIGRRSTT